MNAKVPFWSGTALSILGIWSYFGTATTSLTALIPALFGLALLLLSLASRQERLRVPALYGVLFVALLGFAGSVGSVPAFVSMVSGSVVERPVAVSVQVAMTLFCAGLMLFAAKAMLDERRTQQKQTAPQTSGRTQYD